MERSAVNRSFGGSTESASVAEAAADAAVVRASGVPRLLLMPKRVVECGCGNVCAQLRFFSYETKPDKLYDSEDWIEVRSEVPLDKNDCVIELYSNRATASNMAKKQAMAYDEAATQGFVSTTGLPIYIGEKETVKKGVSGLPLLNPRKHYRFLLQATTFGLVKKTINKGAFEPSESSASALVNVNRAAYVWDTTNQQYVGHGAGRVQQRSEASPSRPVMQPRGGVGDGVAAGNVAGGAAAPATPDTPLVSRERQYDGQSHMKRVRMERKVHKVVLNGRRYLRKCGVLFQLVAKSKSTGRAIAKSPPFAVWTTHVKKKVSQFCSQLTDVTSLVALIRRLNAELSRVPQPAKKNTLIAPPVAARDEMQMEAALNVLAEVACQRNQ